MKFAPATKPKTPAIIALSVIFCLPLVLLGPGCRMVKTAADVPGQAIRSMTPGQRGKPAVDPVEVQQSLLRFADEFSAAMIIDVEKLRRGTNLLAPAEALSRKIALTTEICSIASGPNPIANLLDMTIFVTVTRMALEEYWQPKVYGESALLGLEDCRIAEKEIWRLAGQVLKREQQTELRAAIEAWHRQNPNLENLLAARAMGVATQVAQANRADASKPDSVFNLRMLDPLTGLDPAVREIAETRMFAERALFVTQKMPTLLRWQTELLTVNAVGLPAVEQLVTNSTRIAASVDRFARVAEQLPGQVSAEREAIVQALDSQSRNLTSLAAEIKETLTAGSQMSTSLNTTLITFDALMQRFGVGDTNAVTPPDTNSPPFNILDYAKTAAQLGATAQQLTELLRTLDQTTGSNNLTRLSAQLAPVVQSAQTGGKEIVDYAFWKGILLLALALVAALIYRFLGARMTSTTRSKTNPP